MVTGFHRVALIVGIACVFASASPAVARGRLIRTLDGRQGLPVAAVMSLAQDARGFLWLGSVGGLVRYDGQELRRIAPETLVTMVMVIRAAPDGSLYVADAGGAVWRVVEDIATPLTGHDGKLLAGVEDLWLDPGGTLWVVRDGAVHLRDRDGRWSLPFSELAGVRLVRGGHDGAMYVASRKQVWRIDGKRSSAVAHAQRIVDVLPTSDGNLAVLEHGGQLWRAAGGTMTALFNYSTRAIGLAERGRVIWAVYDSALASVPLDGKPTLVRREDGFVGGGPLLVDAEGSLWLGSSAGLQQYPEPDTAIWSTPDGLPADPRYLVETDEGIWVSSWTGLGRIDVRAGTAETSGRDVRGGVCRDGAGRLWGADGAGEGFIVREAGAFVHYPAPGVVLPNPCDTGPSGRVWFAFRDGVYGTRSSGPPERVAEYPATADLVDTVHEDRHGRLWISARELVCWAALRDPITRQSWQCTRIAGAVALNDFEETTAGTLWAATHQAGVQRWDEATARWLPVPASLQLPSRVILGLAPSPRGGMWILGQGIVLRVDERADRAGWQVLEAPNMWNGLPAIESQDAIETGDGTLWIVGVWFGVYQVPASVRVQVPLAPRVTLTEVRVDGQPADRTQTVTLPYGRNVLQLAFAALSYRDPTLLRYRVRLGAGGAWSEPIRRPTLQLADIAPGTHVAEISASLDGEAWSEAILLHYEVRGPFWREPWAIAVLGIGLLAVGYVVHRIRTAMQLRLERQRVHIAMDLHDEMGSGLGSIGILASLATNTELPDAKRRVVTAEIIEAAEDLGESLGDIVWSLRRGSNTLDALVSHILERGARLLPDGAAELATQLPETVPAVPMSLVVCRSLQLVCFEALHNAARHAHARQVVVGLARADRRRWRLWVDDDGIGLATRSPARQAGSGLGLASMRQRADEIGAKLTIGARPGGGTGVELVFDPGTPVRRKWM